MERADGVVIAGGGPVAVVTALVLARGGVPVTLLEAEQAVVPSPRAIVYHAPTVAVLDRLGVLDDALKLGVLKQDYQFRQADGTVLARLHMSVVADDSAYPYNLHLGQDMLVEIMQRHLMATGLAQVRWGNAVTAVEPLADRVVVRVATVEGERSLQAAWLVGADGARSKVRQSLGLDFAGFTWPERFVAVNLQYDFEALGYARANFVLDPDDWAIIPVLDQRSGWRIAYGEDAGLPEDGVLQRVPGRLARLLPAGARYQVDRVAPYRVHQRSADRYRVGRVLLAGDAAHITNPSGGLGLTSGILDAAHLGAALLAVIQGRAGEAILDDYAHKRRDIFVDHTSPTATENKRRLSERDPTKRQADIERLRRLDGDPQLQREVLNMTSRLVSEPPAFG